MHSNNTATVAAPTVVPLAQVTAPTITGQPVVGQVLTAAGAAATGGVGAVAIAYRWQVASTSSGPWDGRCGRCGRHLHPNHCRCGPKPAGRGAGHRQRRAAPRAGHAHHQRGGSRCGPGDTAAPVLPTAAPRVGVAFGPITTGTWTGGTGTVTLTQQWQLSKDGTTGWAAIAGANGNSYTPLPTEAGQFLRVVQTATDTAVPPVAVAATSAATLAVFSATTLCAGGAVVVRGSVYCDATPGNWTKNTGGYNPITGAISTAGWVSPADSSLILGQPLDPKTQLTYGTPVGVAADWREGPNRARGTTCAPASGGLPRLQMGRRHWPALRRQQRHHGACDLWRGTAAVGGGANHCAQRCRDAHRDSTRQHQPVARGASCRRWWLVVCPGGSKPHRPRA